MADSFGRGFSEGIKQGLPLGVTAYLTGEKNRIDVEKELLKRQEKIAKRNKEIEAYSKLTGLPVETDPTTGQMSIGKPNEDWEFKKNEKLYAELFPELGNEFQQAYTGLEKENTPEYVSYKTRWNPEKKQGEVTAIDKKDGNTVVIGVDPTYKPKKIASDIINDEVEINGQKFGKKGRRTRLMAFEDGTYQTIDLGIKSKTGDKSLTDLEFELELADLGERVDNSRTKRNTYVTGKFADDTARDAYRDGINSEFGELSLQFAKLGSPVAQQEILNYMKDAKQLLKGGTVTAGSLPLDRKAYYEMKKEEVTAGWIAGEWSYRDAMVLLQFLNAKFNQYIPYENSQRNDDELDFDDITNEIQLEKK